MAVTNTFLHQTNKLEFCITCHSMKDNPYKEYQNSIHYLNKKGVRAVCSDCHVPQEIDELLWAKLMAAKDVYGQLTGVVNTPEKYNEHRLEMAQAVWKKLTRLNSSTCKTCHAYSAMNTMEQVANARASHPIALDENRSCIDCHKGLAHKYPDVTSLNTENENILLSEVINTYFPQQKLFAVEKLALFSATDDNQVKGFLQPSSKVTTLAEQDDKLLVNLVGWMKPENNTNLYATFGQDILMANLADSSYKLSEITTKFNEETQQTWRQISLDALVEKNKFVADINKIWNFSSSLLAYNCANCHGAPHPKRYAADDWPKPIAEMVDKTKLTENQHALLLQYMQKHAKDMQEE